MMQLELLISQEEIQQRLKTTAQQIVADGHSEELAIIMVMKGAICLVADLLRLIDLPTTLDFVRARSYGERGMERGSLELQGIDALEITGKNVLLVDDIFDSGVTLSEIITQLKKKNPKSLRSLVLLSKKIPRASSYSPDYILFSIENHFVVGYGLDYKEHYRGLPAIYWIH